MCKFKVEKTCLGKKYKSELHGHTAVIKKHLMIEVREVGVDIEEKMTES